jgi:hypothetical protein
MSKRFPKELFVRIEDDDGDAIYISEKDVGIHAIVDESMPVAKYELVEVGEVTAPAAFKTVRKTRRL